MKYKRSLENDIKFITAFSINFVKKIFCDVCDVVHDVVKIH